MDITYIKIKVKEFDITNKDNGLNIENKVVGLNITTPFTGSDTKIPFIEPDAGGEMKILEVAEGVQYQSSDARRGYQITTDNWASSPTSPAVVAYDESVNEDVTTTVFPNNFPTVSGDKICLSLLQALTVNHSYRIEVKFTVSTETYEFFFRVNCTR